MNRDQIKFLAIITMTCNHIANIFLTPGTLLFEVMIDIAAVRCDIIHTILSGIWHGSDEYAVYLIFVFPDS